VGSGVLWVSVSRGSEVASGMWGNEMDGRLEGWGEEMGKGARSREEEKEEEAG